MSKVLWSPLSYSGATLSGTEICSDWRWGLLVRAKRGAIRDVTHNSPSFAASLTPGNVDRGASEASSRVGLSLRAQPWHLRILVVDRHFERDEY